MIWLLTRACGDKDTDVTTGDSASNNEDSGLVVDSPVDTGEPADVTCSIDGVTPITVPIATEGTEITVTVTCSGDAEVTAARLGGGLLEEFEATTIRDTVDLVLDGSKLDTTGIVAVELDLDVGTLTSPVRAHTPAPVFEMPEGLVELDWDDPLTPVWIGETVLAYDDDQLVELDLDGQVLGKVDHNGLCFYGKCFCDHYYDAGMISGDGDTVTWISMDEGAKTTSFKAEQVVAVTMHEKAPRALIRIATDDTTGGGVYAAVDLATGESTTMGDLPGELALTAEGIHQLEVDDEGGFTFTQYRFGDTKPHTTWVHKNVWPTKFEGPGLSVVNTDADGDGTLDEVLVLSHGGGVELGFKSGTADGEWAEVVKASPWNGNMFECPLPDCCMSVSGDTVVFQGDAGVFSGELLIEGAKATLGEPVHRGELPDGASVCTSGQDDLVRTVAGNWLLGGGASRDLAVSETGETLTRTDGGFEYDGAAIDGVDYSTSHLVHGGVARIEIDEPPPCDQRTPVGVALYGGPWSAGATGSSSHTRRQATPGWSTASWSPSRSDGGLERPHADLRPVRLQDRPPPGPGGN
ncbi:MAG: hypothetical protein GY913_14775 [Proteobacteria bacterium]|nr:hypothetical protein [Pseudomonadota bacterium]MCP4918174.1 hypothetical protein [Pseudomonadota bacterium]